MLVIWRIKISNVYALKLCCKFNCILLVNCKLAFKIAEDRFLKFYLTKNAGEGVFSRGTKAAKTCIFVFVKSFKNSACICVN